MKVAILGSGAAGSVFACYLKKGAPDAEVYLVDLYKAHIEKAAAEGMTFDTPEGSTVIHGFKAAANANEIGIVDLAIIVVKAMQTDAVLGSNAACIGPDTVVVTLQNGLGNDERVKKYVPANRVIFGCGNMGTELPEPAHCIARPFAGENMYFGAVENCERTNEIGKWLEAAFAAGGLRPKFYEDVRPAVWKKATSNSGYNTVCALLRMKVSEVAADPNGMQLVWDIWKECSNVSEAMGIEGIWDYTVAICDTLTKSLGDYYPSMAQDLCLYKRQTEVDALTGAVSMYGKMYGVPTPTCDVCTKAIKAIQANFDKLYLK